VASTAHGATDTSLPTGFIAFARPSIGEAEIAEVVDTLRAGWITTGPKVRRFEERFAAWLAAPGIDGVVGEGVADDVGRRVEGGGLECVAVSSATAGLHLALEGLGIGPGDEVITTTHTFTATAEVVRYLGADVKLVDIDPATLCLDPRAVDTAVTPRTKALIPVHFGGRAADMTAIDAVARRHGLAIVEDAAHALPCTSHRRLVGTLEGSAATVFSFYANKTMTTGEGGMLVTRDAALAARARTMRLHGMSRDAFDRFTSTLPAWAYEVVAPGFKYNLTDIAAALGIHQLARAASMRARRAAIARRYDDAFASLPLLRPPHADEGDLHAWHLYVVRLDAAAPVSRDVFIEQLFARGIGCSVHYIPLHLHPYWRDRYALVPSMFPESQRAYEASVSLPIYSAMSDPDVQRVVDAVGRVLAT
jgi:dTDP-4-amino-4,6-dideoxygalactose transaminase